jgi:hypothetical protein
MANTCSVPFQQGVIVLSGATRSGKTYFAHKLLANLPTVFAAPHPINILFCYAVYQPLYDKIQADIKNITLHPGLPTEEEIDEWYSECETGTHNLIVLDDLAHLIVNNQNLELLLTQGSHHKNISVIIITQNIFQSGKYARSQSLNTQYFVIFRNIRDGNQIKYLSRQLFPSNPQKVIQAYEDAIKERHGYLIIDMHPFSKDKYRLRTKIFPSDDLVIYTDS